MNVYTEYGIISDDHNALSKYTESELNEFKYLKYKLKKKMTTQDDTIITLINIHPVDRLCYGTCSYCYFNSYHVDKNFGRISNERFEEFLNKIKHILNDSVSIKFTGGSCFLYDHIYDLINIAKKYIKNLHVRFHADLMYNETTYKRALEVLDKLIDDDRVLSVSMYITIDFGSDTRYSRILNISSDTIKKRAEYIVDTYGKYDKFQVELKTNISTETDKNKLLYELENFIDKKCFIIYNLVRDLKYTPSIKHLKNIIDSIEKIYETKVIYWREIVILNDTSRKKLKNNDIFNHVFLKTSLGDYMYSPYYIDCAGYISTTGISSNKYLPCFIGYLEEDTISETLKYSHSPDSEQYKQFLELTDECKKCKLAAVCMSCMFRRPMLPCSKLPALKWWEYYIWSKKVLEKDYHVYM